MINKFKVIVFNSDEFSMNKNTALGIIYELNVSSFGKIVEKLNLRKDDWIMVDYDCVDNHLLSSRNPNTGNLLETYLKTYIIKNYGMRIWAKEDCTINAAV